MKRTTLTLITLLACAPLVARADVAPGPRKGARPAPQADKPKAGADNKKANEKGAGTVVTTASGLKYVDEQVGTGASPQKGQRVSVHYTGTLASNGSKFDSSVDRGRPFSFVIGVGQVIAGWDEGVITMKVGGKRKLMVPAKLGYGPRGFPPVIPPNSDLNFDVELLGVE